MSFTSQRSFAGKQTLKVRSSNGLVLCSESVINWSPVLICSSVVGSQRWQYGLPGFENQDNFCGSNPSDRTPAQIHVSMKNARKETGTPVSDKPRVNGPLSSKHPNDQSSLENQVFSEKPEPRQPESPDVESLRSLLKANMTREKASPALIERIRSRMRDDKA